MTIPDSSSLGWYLHVRNSPSCGLIGGPMAPMGAIHHSLTRSPIPGWRTTVTVAGVNVLDASALTVKRAFLIATSHLPCSIREAVITVFRCGPREPRNQTPALAVCPLL